MNKKRDGKITLGMLKGKPMTTSVPSISIRFHANAEQLEEIYASDEEQPSTNDSSVASTGAISTSAGASESESSPLKYLPRLVKRSTSIDITPTTNLDASPPSDPWRFFSDIKGKITKSVEEKITEIKARNQEDGSPLRSKTVVKDSRDNSSLSDSEELSESSISKTCGIASTTEGVEMSSDEDTPSLDRDKKLETGIGLRQRFRLLRHKAQAHEGTVGRNALAHLYNINTDKIEQAVPYENDAVESAVDALEDVDLQQKDEQLLRKLEKEFENIKVGNDDVVNVKQMHGSEMRPLHWNSPRPRTVYSPIGFVDMRAPPPPAKKFILHPIYVLATFSVAYYCLHSCSNYFAGFIVGAGVTFLFFYIKSYLQAPAEPDDPGELPRTPEIVKVQAAQEFQPLLKQEGWMNELPEYYNPHTYHISQTQSVFLRLQGNLLRMSHCRANIPKRALWNEPQLKPVFTHHRIYNMLGAKVSLLPDGLARKRRWSKKYPICLVLNRDQMEFESVPGPSKGGTDEEQEPVEKEKPAGKKRKFPFSKKKKYAVPSQRFSKLTEENEEYDLESENEASRASSPSPDISEDPPVSLADEEAVTNLKLVEALEENLNKDEQEDLVFEDEFDSVAEEWFLTSPSHSPGETQVFLFGRTDREKEDWYRRLTAATHKGGRAFTDEADNNMQSVVSETLCTRAMTVADYVNYMSVFYKVPPGGAPKSGTNGSESDLPPTHFQWINALLGRILFDCFRNDFFTDKVKERIQRKLSSIKLPYFIDELVVTELTLGHTPPIINKIAAPYIDDRGLWIDLDLTYEGTVVLILQTNLNLMKLKQPHVTGLSGVPRCLHDQTCMAGTNKACFCLECSRVRERLAMFNSDLEDSAESTSDEEVLCLLQNPPVLDAQGLPVQGLGGTSNTSKKFIKMVDQIADSKFFKAATNNRYIKRAMEGVSNTDLRLRVEVLELVGTLVLNIPPPPSDRVWMSFRPVPELVLSAHPIVGERNITFMRVTSWIEKKLLQEFQKLLVIPNMEDITIPVMTSELPH